jgi:hypothetical protein
LGIPDEHAVSIVAVAPNPRTRQQSPSGEKRGRFGVVMPGQIVLERPGFDFPYLQSAGAGGLPNRRTPPSCEQRRQTAAGHGQAPSEKAKEPTPPIARFSDFSFRRRFPLASFFIIQRLKQFAGPGIEDFDLTHAGPNGHDILRGQTRSAQLST